MRNDILSNAKNRACAHCYASFTPKRGTARYCSIRCRVAAHRLTPEQTRKRQLEKTRRWMRRAYATKINAAEIGDLPLPHADRALEVLKAMDNPNVLTLNLLEYERPKPEEEI